jgi:DNA-binding HxlR family transcriptional regulator
MLLGCRTFGEIRDGAPGIPRALLSERLRQLEHYGVITRSPNPVGRGYVCALVLATPLAQSFLDAPDDRQELIVGHVNEAARKCAGGEVEIRFPMRANVAVAVAP